MWLGEQITERGIGNGMSLIIFCGIVIGLPRAIQNIVSKLQDGEWNAFGTSSLILIMMVAVVAFIVLVERGERRIPVQYAKRVIGRRMMGGQSTHLPLKVNAGGVIPVIFASSLLAFPHHAVELRFRQEFAVAVRACWDAIKGAAAHVLPALHGADYFLLLLLRFHHLQSQ